MDRLERLIDKVVHPPEIDGLHNEAMAQAEARLIVNTLTRAITKLYRRSEYGQFWEVNPLTYQICPVPWSTHGMRRYNIDRTTGDLIRRAMMLTTGSRSVFLWDELRRRWYLNVERYPDEASAMKWLQDMDISGAMVHHLRHSPTERPTAQPTTHGTAQRTAQNRAPYRTQNRAYSAESQKMEVIP